VKTVDCIEKGNLTYTYRCPHFCFRTLQDFQKGSASEAIAQMKFDHFEMRRKEKLKAAKGERKIIIDYLEQLQHAALSVTVDDSNQGKQTTPRGSLPPLKGIQKVLPAEAKSNPGSAIGSGVEDVQGATMMELERKRLENLQARQQKEIQQMMDYELKMVTIAEENAKKLALEQKRAEENKKLKETRRLAALERKRKDDLRKRAEEEEEMRKRREMATKEFAEEQKLIAMAKEKEKEIQKLARLKEQQRLEKQESQRAQTEAILKNIELKAIKKMEEMEAAEVLRKEKMALAKEAHAKNLLEKRKKAEKRIADTLYQQNLLLEEKRKVYSEKQNHAAERQKELELKQQEEIRKKMEER
jgi:hypothetical protein